MWNTVEDNAAQRSDIKISKLPRKIIKANVCAACDKHQMISVEGKENKEFGE